MSPTPGRSTLITSAPNQARSWVQVGPDCTWVKSRMRTPVRALPASPQALLDGRGRWPLPFVFFAAVLTVLAVLAVLDLSFATFFEAALALPFDFLRVAIDVFPLDSLNRYFFFCSLLCGLRLPIRPLSLPAAGSITALIKVGLPLSMAALTARLSSSGLVALTPTPPKASIILS